MFWHNLWNITFKEFNPAWSLKVMRYNLALEEKGSNKREQRAKNRRKVKAFYEHSSSFSRLCLFVCFLSKQSVMTLGMNPPPLSPHSSHWIYDTQTNLLHEKEHMGLGCFQHIAMRMVQAFYCETHRPAINVDPARCTRGQEGPGHTGWSSLSFCIADIWRQVKLQTNSWVLHLMHEYPRMYFCINSRCTSHCQLTCKHINYAQNIRKNESFFKLSHLFLLNICLTWK